MSTAPIDTVFLAVSLIALTFAFVAHVVTERRQVMLRTAGIAGGSANPATRYNRRTVVPTPPLQVAAGRALSASDARQFSQAFTDLQSHFADNPKGAVAAADDLVRELLERRGYSLEERMDHPAVVTTYLAAQAITARHGRSEADTEAMHTAVLYYRGLFDQLLRGTATEARA